MFKKRNFSVYDDFKTGFFYKLSLALGIILLLIYVFLKILSLLVSEDDGGFVGLLHNLANSGFAEPVIAFSIILLGVGFILYFFHLQFIKLGKIADDVEKDLADLEEKEEVAK